MNTAAKISAEHQTGAIGLSGEERDALVLRHLPQVRIVAHRIAEKLPHHIEMADLIGAGVLGLMDAVKKFDPTHDASLATYAQFRIRGAILDSLRSQDWSPRRLRRVARSIAQARQALATSLGRTPTEPEIASHLGISLAEFQNQLSEVRSLEIASFVDAADEEARGLSIEDVPSPEPNALQTLLGSEMKERLAAAVDTLPQRERQVVALYYVEELTMKEVGSVMGIGESRVCQIHSSALARLKKVLNRADSTRATMKKH